MGFDADADYSVAGYEIYDCEGDSRDPRERVSVWIQLWWIFREVYKLKYGKIDPEKFDLHYGYSHAGSYDGSEDNCIMLGIELGGHDFSRLDKEKNEKILCYVIDSRGKKIATDFLAFAEKCFDLEKQKIIKLRGSPYHKIDCDDYYDESEDEESQEDQESEKENTEYKHEILTEEEFKKYTKNVSKMTVLTRMTCSV